MSKKFFSLTMAWMMILALVLTGCTGTATPTTSAPAGTSPSEAGTSDATEPAQIQQRSLTIALVNDPVSLDPHAKDSGTEMMICAHIYDPLVDYNPDLSLKPGLAESWKILDDGLTWEFNLRRGVKFQNGNDFNADDVVYSLDRARSDDLLDMGVYLFRIAEVNKIDDYTVQIVTKIKYPVFASSLKHILMLDKETTEGMTSDEISNNPNGTGRYKLVEHVTESHLDMIRNEEYWGDKPVVTDVRFRMISSAATRTAALLSGDVDFISSVPVMDVERLKAQSNIQIMSMPSLSCNYLGFNQDSDAPSGTISPNPLKNELVRRAIYHAIDLDSILTTTMQGFATAAVSFMPSVVNGFDSTAQRYEYNPETAKQLLTEAGYPDGFPLRIDAISDGAVNESQVVQAIAGNLETIGIKMEINLIPRAMFRELTSISDMKSSFFMGKWGDSSGEGVVILNDMVYTYEGKPGMGEGNKGKYSNSEVDAMLDTASVCEDAVERAKIVSQVDAITREAAAYIPLFFMDDIYGVRSGLGYTPRVDGAVMVWDFTFAD